MSLTDPIADFLTCVRNACRAKHRKVEVPTSRLKVEIAKALLREGYISNFKVIEDTRQGVLRVYLKYQGQDRCVISGLKRVSTPGRRIYKRKDDIPRILGGLGSVILSTSQGVMTDKEARRAGLGGEVLAQVW
ncbi:MAG TPA: 30S ribosomal protein S8 [Candidatus Eisenbacteria bacterium]|jgi:small subunit ribosomal protein S8|nr:30S ribosomal protein S8 [Candidatus Eisenbacteria bacterium]